MTQCKTKRTNVQNSYVPGTSRRTRSAATLRRQAAQAEAARLLHDVAKTDRQIAMGQRIKERRKELRMTQPVLADKVGVTLRAEQEWEAGGGIAWTHLPKLAKVLKVTEDWILSGPEPEVAADPLNDLRNHLTRLEAKLDELLKRPGEDPPA